ncbi:methylmalonyl-CoA mutase [Methylotenera sp.]|uniref:methylmalonyl-CoA mutase n=1 Tax=Methylotenera sp. TaxID=2051956 RepID=UPI002736FAAE|nr:methylmalonyl-CoA mutase [Methylotenera sp.]MDP3777651.1 methylmalonyl-CoA mutase [Methylotenera sp.]
MNPQILNMPPEIPEFDNDRALQYKSIYTAKDLLGIKYLNSLPGEEPFLRGPYATMYTQRPWTIRQYAGFGDASTTNQLYIDAISKGAKGLSIAFDLPTHRGWDSDSINSIGDVGKAGVAIDSVEDMKQLLQDVPLNQISVSMTMNGAVLPIMASFLVAAEELGFKYSELSGTIQNDILKEFMVRNTYIFPPEFSLRVAGDIVEFNSKNVPKFNSMSISGYHFQEAGADPILELALTLSNAKTYIGYAISKGWNIDTFCEQLTFFFCVGSNFYLEIAKLRAARVLWATMLDELGVTSKKAKTLRMHCQTSGWSLVASDPLNNVVRTTAQAMAAAFGGTQSLHTNSYDEAYSLPTEESSKVARDTQKILQEETGICDVIDPWAGSYMMEKMTSDVMTEVRQIINEINARGGMLKALDKQWIQSFIQTRSAKTQAKLDSGEQKIIGKNSILLNSVSLDFNSEEIRKQQTDKLKLIKRERDALKVKRALKNLTAIGKFSRGNLLEATIEAIKCRATVQECTEALEQTYARFNQSPVLIKGAYDSKMSDIPEWGYAKFCVHNLSIFLKRAPRILISKLGQDGHDRGANVISAILSDAGCDIKQVPLFYDIQDIVKLAEKFGADLIAVSSLANAHNELMPKLIHELNTSNLHIPVALGGIVPIEHHSTLLEHGVAYIMKPGVSIAEAIPLLMNTIQNVAFKSVLLKSGKIM